MDNLYFIAAAWIGPAARRVPRSERMTTEALAAGQVEAADEIEAGPLRQPRRAETA